MKDISDGRNLVIESGQDLIDMIVAELEVKGEPPTDSAIIREMCCCDFTIPALVETTAPSKNNTDSQKEGE